MELEDALFEEMPRRWTDERWSKCNRKALTQIHLHLSNEILRDVHKETSAYKLWLQLAEIFMAKTVSRRMLTKQRLFGLCMLEGTSLELHISKFKEVISDLEAMDANTLIEEDLCCLLLMSLPASYTAFRDTLFYGHKDLSLRTVYESLSSKEIINHMTNGPVTEAEGLVDGYYVAYKPITLSSILFMFIEMKFIHCHSCVMFAMKYMSMCND